MVVSKYKYWHSCVVEDVVRDAPKHCPSDGSLAARSHDNVAGLLLVCHVDDSVTSRGSLVHDHPVLDLFGNK